MTPDIDTKREAYFALLRSKIPQAEQNVPTLFDLAALTPTAAAA